MIRFQRRVNSLLTVVMLVTAVGFYFVARMQQAEVIASYSENRLRHVEQAARNATEAFHGIADALRLAAHLLQTAPVVDHSRELTAYLRMVPQFCMINVYDNGGHLTLSVHDPTQPPPFKPALFTDLMAEAARKTALQAPGEVFTSRVRSFHKGWFQAFGLAYGPGGGRPNTGVVVILIDHYQNFQGEARRTTESHSTLLLLDDYGDPAPLASREIDELLAEAGSERGRESGAAALLLRMRRGETGTQLVGSARRYLLLRGPRLVAAFAPIPARHGGSWMLARLTQAELLREELAAGYLRLLLAYVAVMALLLGLRGVMLDAARRGAALRERLRQAETLAHLTEKANKILDTIPSGVMALTSDGRVSAMNSWLRSRVPASALGQPLHAAFPEAPVELVERLARLAQAALAEDKVHSLFGERLVLFGQEGQYTIKAVPLEPRFPDSRLLLVIEDHSEVGSLASQLLRTEKLATVGVLAAGVAHEVGTPLGIVRGRAEYLLGKIGGAHPQASGVHVIIEQIDLVSRSLRQLLDFARVKAVAVRAVPLQSVALAVAELLRFEASRHQAAISVVVSELLPPLAADPDQLQQVLVNLVLNACDACAARGSRAPQPGEVRITGELPMEGGERSSRSARSGRSLRPSYVNIVVSDNGCGIPREDLHRVFDPFFTTKKRGQGTGLGLTIAAQIVRNHSGYLEIDSEVGGGTRVVIRWPTVRSAGLAGDRLSVSSLGPVRTSEHLIG